MSVSNTTKRVKVIRRKTSRKFSSEEKIRIVLEGLRSECSIAELIVMGQEFNVTLDDGQTRGVYRPVRINQCSPEVGCGSCQGDLGA